MTLMQMVDKIFKTLRGVPEEVPTESVKGYEEFLAIHSLRKSIKDLNSGSEDANIIPAEHEGVCSVEVLRLPQEVLDSAKEFEDNLAKGMYNVTHKKGE